MGNFHNIPRFVHDIISSNMLADGCVTARSNSFSNNLFHRSSLVVDSFKDEVNTPKRLLSNKFKLLKKYIYNRYSKTVY